MTHLPISSARALFVASAALLLATAPVQAGGQSEPEKPVTDDTVTAKDVAITPITDLNLKKDKIPDILVAAQKDPYDITGLRKCSQYQAAVRDLDTVLGPDFDIAGPEQRRLTAGRVAQAVVGALIPFRGVIREVSGANKHQREFQDAILAGMMRRAFLKGMGLKLGCSYPGRPADEATKARIAALAQDEAEKQAKDKDK